jgi:hypothetical protein
LLSSADELLKFGRSFQSLLFVTPGVTQPNYFQTGGINNPSRSMEFDVNGTPTGLMVVRIDGITATNQWISGLQAYTPSIEAIETVNFSARVGIRIPQQCRLEGPGILFARGRAQVAR